MTPERWQKIKNVFQSALGHEPEQRSALLDKACANDDEMRGKVEAMLHAHAEAGSFIEAPAVDVAAELMAEEQTGSRIGEDIGPYRIVSRLGAGGMGEVYLAQDHRLGRQVALKLLPEYFTTDGSRVKRFQQEARAASAISHPNIATLYDIGDVEGVNYIAMEYVRGETLAARLQAGSLENAQVIDIGIQVVDALKEAHGEGIIHRDIKSGNIMITPDGRVKVVDFGLARVTRTEEPALSGDGVLATTTEPSLVMGTVAYMSPEQALGRAFDQRTDLFSLGVVLYEMTTGRLPFSGANGSETIDKIVHAQPEALARFNYTLPARLEQIIRKCLEKEPDRRYQSARDVLIDLKNLKRDLEAGAAILERSAEQQPVPHHRGFVRSLWQGPSRAILAILIALGALTVAQIYFQRAPVEVRAVRSFVLPPENWSLALNNQLAVSPDGRRLAFIATTVEGNSLLWVRSLDTLSAQALAGTEGGRHPFWSRDSRFLGFFANGKLKKIDASGGPALALCDAPMGRGGTWNRDGVIIFAPFLTSALHRVSASGGVSSPVTELDEARGEGTHRWPHFLPDGQHFLYLARRDPRSESEGAIFVASLESKESKRLVPTNSNAAYAQGHLLFMRQETLMAQPFDPDRLEATGDAFPLADEIRYLPAPNTIGLFSVSQNGVLAYQSSREGRDRRLTWFDRNGKPLGVLGDVAHYGEFSLSPDNKRVLAVILEPKTGNRDLWNYEVTRNLRTRYTFDRASEGSPVWSPDGSSIILHSNRKGYHDLYQKAASGAGSEELLLESNISKYPTSRSPDGRFLLYHTVDSKTANDLWILPLQGDQESKIPRGEPFPFSHTEFNELRGQFSSDGRWVAYESNESGRGEIYVVPFPGPGAKRQISTSGGRRPIWRGDGKEIFYTTTPGNKLAAVEVNGDGATLEVGVMRPLFDYGGGEWDAYDVTADGQRFLISMAVEEKAPSPITLVQNWTADLKR